MTENTCEWANAIVYVLAVIGALTAVIGLIELAIGAWKRLFP